MDSKRTETRTTQDGQTRITEHYAEVVPMQMTEKVSETWDRVIVDRKTEYFAPDGSLLNTVREIRPELQVGSPPCCSAVACPCSCPCCSGLEPDGEGKAEITSFRERMQSAASEMDLTSEIQAWIRTHAAEWSLYAAIAGMSAYILYRLIA